jgi:tetratricopeptide (TPR) repeat protein
MITKNQLKLKGFSLQVNYNYYINNYDKDIKWYDKLLESDPNNALILFNKGLVFYHIQNFGKAIE